MSLTTTAAPLALLLAACAAAPAFAQDATATQLDEITVYGVRTALTVPQTAQAEAEIQRTAGGVEVIPDTAFKSGPAAAIKDILAYVPGVVTQPRFGPDARLSIRGSGLSRAYGNRGLNAYIDGAPLNTSDGLLDLSEIDPTAYRYVEVFKGANALRYGGNSFGGALNFVSPTGRDAQAFDGRLDIGSFGFVRGQVSSGGVDGRTDGFVTFSSQTEDGYREHSQQDFNRLNANLGYRLSPNAETRFYLNAYTWRSRIPGEVSKDMALNDPTAASPDWIVQDQQRNIDSVRLTNKTAVRFGDTSVDFGAYGLWRHVMHPIYQWLDFTAEDYGLYARARHDGRIGGFENRFVLGATVANGRIDTEQFINLPGAVKGDLASSMVDSSDNITLYAEDTLKVRPGLSLIAGVQYLHASRERRDRFLSNGDQSGRASYDLWSPRIGILWDVDSSTQVFANVSRSAEIPTYDANAFSTPDNLEAQTATTYEVGARGRRGEASWDVAIYRAEIENELQCLTLFPWAACTVVNAGPTVHQGIEAGGSAPVLGSTFVDGDRLVLTAAYTLNDFAFDGDPTFGDNALPGVPRHLLRAEALYRHPSGVYFGPNVEWSPSEYFADNANTLTVDSYALLGLRLGYDAPQGWSAYVEGRNLTDERYISTVAVAGTASPASQLFNPGTGRSAYAGVRYRF